MASFCVIRRVAFVVLLLADIAALHSQGSGNLRASLAELPGFSELRGAADPRNFGPFLDLVNAIGDRYRDGKITIATAPFARSVNNVVIGKADFHVPSIRNPRVDQSRLPYGTVKVPMGRVAFVIYSNSTRILTSATLGKAIEAGGDFPYSIDVAGGIEDQFPFPKSSTNDIGRSLRKVAAGRIDALVWAQEDADIVLKSLGLGNIHREFWMEFDDVIIIPKGERGDRLDRILSFALVALRDTGRLEPLHSKIHRPYSAWQPADSRW